MSLPIIILGAGCHAKVLADALKAAGKKVLGFTDAEAPKAGSLVLGIPVLGTDEVLKKYKAADVALVNGVGGVKNNRPRQDLFDKYRALGYQFVPIRHPAALIADGVELGQGAQVMAGAILQTGVTVGENVIINTGAIIEHDCQIGAHAHVASGAVLSGAAVVGEGAHIGAGATVIQRVRIGSHAVIGAGAVVIRDVPAGVTVVGVPAQEKRS